jgi:sialic acid synthase
MIELEFNQIVKNGSGYVIAEIGHNHQGELDKALEMVKVAATHCKVHAVKFQKRHNKELYTKKFYNRAYGGQNSYGSTYGEHREALEFDKAEYQELINCAKKYQVDFMSTAFDIPSVDFLEESGVSSYKIASGDVTNTNLIEYMARLKKPLFLSTGASTLAEIRIAHDIIRNQHDKLCILHCIATYPAENQRLNLKILETLKNEFPDVILGYSGHELGILASITAHLLGATVIEKHFTLDHNWKGTDHKMSLEPEMMKTLVESLAAIPLMYGNDQKIVNDYEMDARVKMGKSIYTAKALPNGATITPSDICIKSPGGYLPPYELPNILGKKLVASLSEEEPIVFDVLEK